MLSISAVTRSCPFRAVWGNLLGLLLASAGDGWIRAWAGRPFWLVRNLHLGVAYRRLGGTTGGVFAGGPCQRGGSPPGRGNQLKQPASMDWRG